MRYIKNQQWLYDHLNDPTVIIVDCRFNLTDPTAGCTAYEQSHIPNAVYFHIVNDLSGSLQTHGGRHPLPNLLSLKEKLEKAGIHNETTVVAYDEKEGAYAGRFWWLLTYLGHKNVYILDGGFNGWISAERPVTNAVSAKNNLDGKNFKINIQQQMLSSYEEVKEVVKNGGATLIDSRSRNRYLGLEEPIDKKPGHIPSAINKVWEEGINEGYWKSVEEQKARYFDVDQKKPVIVYCGSGITATPNVLTLIEAGFSDVKLYAGSYSDWVSYPENEVITVK